MSAIPPPPRDVLIGLLDRLNARAAGFWRISDDGQRLEQAAFVSAEEMAGDVASAFASATRSVPLDRVDLGIVRAVTTGQVVVVSARQVSGATGSAQWLREFGAERSVSLPLLDVSGTVRSVIAIALTPESPDDSIVAEVLREAVSEPRT